MTGRDPAGVGLRPTRVDGCNIHGGPMPRPSHATLRPYGLALLAVGLATAIRLGLSPVLGDRFPFLTFFIAIVVTAWYGSLGPSLVAVCLSWLAIERLVLQPSGSAASFFDSR